MFCVDRGMMVGSASSLYTPLQAEYPVQGSPMLGDMAPVEHRAYAVARAETKHKVCHIMYLQ